jgi:hypothetical protein
MEDRVQRKDRQFRKLEILHKPGHYIETSQLASQKTRNLTKLPPRHELCFSFELHLMNLFTWLLLFSSIFVS